MKWVRQVVCGTTEMHAVFWCGNAKEEDHLGNLGTDGKIILK